MKGEKKERLGKGTRNHCGEICCACAGNDSYNDVQRSWTKLTHGRLAQLSAYNESQLIIRPDIPPSACVRAPRKMARSTKAFDA